ncbi:hypothetical protein DFH07DRAFT_788200 [Mycena maculata]|uniref:Uncharacterized protein n=1 Tax=Mycena maculata TaxID=230809 RepID=A0AAD7KHX1_9AGAR|nr:hypothetical protein DFH07DRAFT_788200 [Mycena maculata]
MASGRTKHHCRSHSASSSPIARSPGGSWRAATKRAHPQPFGSASPDLSSPQKWDVDMWRRGKRRRRNMSSDSDSMDVDFGRSSFHSSPVAAPSTPSFLAATAAEFHLFPQNNRTTDRKRRTTHHTESALDFNTNDRTVDLMQLRSDAFWQLQRSVEENGEGFVKSMRVYETRRLRSNVYGKVKEAQRRGRRRSPSDSPASDPRGDSKDEDVQIFAGEPTKTSFASRGKQRAFSVGVVDDIPHHSPPDFAQSDRCSSPGATCDSSSSIYPSDDDGFHISAPNPQHSPALSHTLSHSANSSFISLSLPPPFAPKVILPSSRSEKAIAALSLLMANGAGGLDDYEALRSLHTFSPDNCEVGEMWH